MTYANVRLIPLLAVLVAASGCSELGTAPNRTPAEVRVSPDTVMVSTGQHAQFQVELLDENGDVYDVIPSWAPPLWSSDRPDRIDIDGTTLTPIRGGEQRVQVDLAGVMGSAVLRANPAEMGVSVAMAYLTQSVQRTVGDVALVGGRDALLRVAVIGDDENYFRPVVEATFTSGGAVVHTATLELEREGVPLELREGFSEYTYDALIPGSVLQPGVGMVLEIDPQGVVPASAGSTLRIPASGTASLDVREVAPFRLMLVPVTLAENGGRLSRFSASTAELNTRLTRDIFPLEDVEVTLREPYVTHARLDTENGWYQLIEEMYLLRWDDGNPHYYYGGFWRPAGTNIGGLGYVGYPVSIGMDDRPDVIAHEIGHNFNLPHAPCGEVAGGDPNYPHAEGRVGAYGYERYHNRIRDRDRYDLMSYCDPIWISDYNYERVLAYRDSSEYDAAFESAAAAALPATGGTAAGGTARTLLVRGGVFDGELRLEPALEWTGRVELPGDGGRYTLQGFDQAGGLLFSLAFEPRALDHGGSQFLMALPEGLARIDALHRLRVRGPEGTAERSRPGRPAGAAEIRLERTGGAAGAPASVAARWDASAYPLAVVRDRATGRIRAMSRTGTIELPDADPARFEVMVSDGIRSQSARMVQP